MPKLSTKPNRFYPSIPAIAEDTATHSTALRVIKEAVETHERRNNNYLKSFVRFEELVALGIIDSSGEFILDTGGGSVTVKNSIEEDAGDLQLVGDLASPGNDMHYGTSAGGIKGWYTIPTGGAEVNDLTAAVVWVNVPDANITAGSVTQHEAALTILESQITDANILARIAGNESIIGEWDFVAGAQVVRRSKSTAITTVGSGWYRVAKATGQSGRGSFDIQIYTVGGTEIPQFLRIVGHKNWSATAFFDQIYNSANTFWTGVRVVDDTVLGDTYVEVNFSQAMDSNTFIWAKDAHFLDKFVPLTGALVAHDVANTVRLTQNLTANYLHVPNLVVGDVNPTGTVDGRDVAADGSTQDDHIADAGKHIEAHTGEITGAVDLSLDVTAISNRSSVVADSLDDAAIYDATDGTLRRTSLNSITDGGYF